MTARADAVPRHGADALRLDRFFARAVLVSFAAAALAALCAQSALFQRIQAWCEDAAEARLGSDLPLDRVVVIDVDEESMQRLEPTLGAWPYDRFVYADVARFLAASGARAVAYDILFAEARPGDAEFGAALGPGSVLAAAALQPQALADARPTRDRVARLAREPAQVGTSRTAPRRWSDLTLPVPPLLANRGVGVGVISAIADADGVIRRLHLTHEAYGRILPSLPLAAVLAAEPGTALRDVGTGFSFGQLSWPAASDGSIRLRFPSNARALPTIPFYQAAWAAQGRPGTAHLADAVRDKIVYIGSSSAILGDVVLTPVGQVPGVQLGGIASELLLAGRAYRAPRAALDAMLLLAALLPAIALILLRRTPGPWTIVAGFAAVAAAPCIGGLLFFASGQPVAWLVALVAGLLAQGLALVAWLLDLQRERLRLRYEKLAAETASRMKSEFLNRMTHELRTPLTAIMGFNKLNRFGDALGREQRVLNSDAIARNCEHLLALVNENLDLARIEAGQLVVARSPADPAALADEVVASLRGVEPAQASRLSLRAEGRLPASIAIDAVRVRQILFNLAGNALRHAGDGPVEVAVAHASGELRLDVRDHGPGLPDAVRARLFEPFAPASAGGTGLGLAITRRLVQAMDGRIEVASSATEGTRVTVSIPAAEAALPEATANPAPARGRLAGRVLLAEDHADLRALLGFQLEEIGIDCTSVADGLAAVAAAEDGGFDAILLDLEMPRMDGYEAVRVLRTRGVRSPILALTAHDQPADAERALAEGFTRVLCKPVPLEILRDALGAHLPASRAPARARRPAGAPDLDARIADLFAGFVASAEHDLAAARDAVARHQYEPARRLGHSLKGSAASYGLPEAGHLGGMLEFAARARDADSVRLLADQLEQTLDAARRAATAGKAA